MPTLNPLLKALCIATTATALLLACKPLEKDDTSEETADTQALSTSVVSLQDSLIWDDCTSHSDWFDEIPESMQCATLTVPLDNSYPKGKTLDLALTKLPATGDYPIGSLLVIAGGPGDTSLDAVMTSFGDNKAVQDIKANFDIIGFAPRGVAPSEPALNCGDDTDETDDVNSEAFVKACLKHSGKELLAHISTQDAVLDIERIRLALGEKRLSLIGYSYGTKVLARYVEAYPNSVRAAVLDGVVDVTEDYFTALAGQEKGFQATFERFAEYCTDFDACPFSDAKDYQVGFWAFLNEIDNKNLHDKQGNPITSDDVLALIQDNMLWRSDWDTIIMLMEELQDNKTDVYNELTEENDGATSDLGLIAINCADGAPADKSDYLNQAKAVDALSPYNNYRKRDDDYYLDACYYWQQVGSDSLAVPVVADSLPQILFVAQKHDPTTPYQNAVRMAKLFNAPLITRDGDGHTLALTGESACVDDSTVQYLKSPTTPIYSKSCE